MVYEMAFSATSGERNIMDLLGLADGIYVVNINDIEMMNRLFESSYRKELHKNPVCDISWCANIINIIQRCMRFRDRGRNGAKTGF